MSRVPEYGHINTRHVPTRSINRLIDVYTRISPTENFLFFERIQKTKTKLKKDIQLGCQAIKDFKTQIETYSAKQQQQQEKQRKHFSLDQSTVIFVHRG